MVKCRPVELIIRVQFPVFTLIPRSNDTTYVNWIPPTGWFDTVLMNWLIINSRGPEKLEKGIEPQWGKKTKKPNFPGVKEPDPFI